MNDVINYMYVRGEKERLNQLLSLLETEDGEAIDFYKIAPMTVCEDKAKWRLQHWGTASNAYESFRLPDLQTKKGNAIVFSFLTENTHPGYVFYDLANILFPDLDFLFLWADEGLRQNCGFIKQVDNRYYRYDFSDNPQKGALFAKRLWDVEKPIRETDLNRLTKRLSSH